MSKLRSLFFHAWCIPSSLVTCLVLSAPGCGEKTTIGQVVPEPDGGANGKGGSAAGPTDGATGTSSGGESGSGGGGASGEAGEAGSAGSAMADAGTKTACGLPQPEPIPNPTAAERERAGMIRSLCERLAEVGCLDSITSPVSQLVADCPRAERIIACEQDLLHSYSSAISPPCDDEWQALIRCEIATGNASERCVALDPSNTNPGHIVRCRQEHESLTFCAAEHPTGEFVTGARARCWVATIDLTCSVSCQVPNPSGTSVNVFHTQCSAEPGLPHLCYCNVNANALWDVGPLMGKPFVASGCREVGQMMADGECIERLDCCVQWPASDGGQKCLCMANDRTGAPSCEAAAQAAGGSVVEICPQYKLNEDHFTCWPPWDAACQPR